MSYDFLNPLLGIFETDYSPHARTMRTTWGQKIKDAFFVLAGDHPFMNVSFFGYSLYKNAEKPHFGFVDWLLLGIPYALSSFVFEYTSDTWWVKWFLLKPLQSLVFTISIPFHMVRLILAAVLTIPAIFITGFVQAAVELFEGAGAGLTNLVMHLPITVGKTTMAEMGEACTETKENISNAGKEVYNAAVKKLGGAKYDIIPYEKPKDPSTIGEYLTKHNLTLEDLTFVEVENPSIGEPKVVFSCQKTNEKIHYTPIFSNNVKAIDKKNLEYNGNRAVFELNVGKSAEIMQSENMKADIDQFLANGKLPGIKEKAANLVEQASGWASSLNPFSK